MFLFKRFRLSFCVMWVSSLNFKNNTKKLLCNNLHVYIVRIYTYTLFCFKWEGFRISYFVFRIFKFRRVRKFGDNRDRLIDLRA